MGSLQSQFPLSAVSPTSQEVCEATLVRLADRRDAWTQVGLADRVAYLRRCIVDVQAVADAWVEAACHAKGIDPTSSLAGEEWLAGPVAVVRNLRLLIRSLEAGGQPRPAHWRSRPDGQVIAQVFPEDWHDRILWQGFRAEVWIEPGQPSSQGAIYRESGSTGKVALVLAAGNVSSIAPQDALYKLFAENQVVLLKMNPVNDYLGGCFEKAFQCLHQDGFLEFAYGGREVGEFLCHHPLVDTVHLTGSHRTHDAIVWGNTAEEQAERRSSQSPKLTKPITSELGCVTPVLVVPGNWSDADLRYQARHVASMVANNASFNCAAAKVLVLARGWHQREAFLQFLQQEMTTLPPRAAYYPGAQQRYQAFLDRYPLATPLGVRTETIVPWTLIPDVPPEVGEYALTEEAFCGVLAEVSLDVSDGKEFLSQAVEFVNDRVWGTLSCAILIHPTTQKSLGEALDTAIAQLRYGAIGINAWSAINYGLGLTPWGAFPPDSLETTISGRGVVHNTCLFDHPQKSVVYAPFRMSLTPPWFVTHKTLRQLGQRLLAYEAAPTVAKLVQVILTAVRGQN